MPHGLWRAVRPKIGATVCVRYVPGVTAFGLWVLNASAQLGFGVNAAFAIAGVAQSALVSLGISVAVSALASSLIPLPPKQHELPDPEQLYQLDGWRNRANPNEAIPFPVGRIRMSPLFASRPYSEIIDGDQYLFGLFVWGHGRLDISDLRIADTALSALGDVVVNTREGTSGDAPLAMIREQVIEDRLSIELSPPTPDPVVQIWTSPRSTDRIRLILQFPGGLFHVEKDGRMKSSGVTVRIEQRPVGAEDWDMVEELAIGATTNSGFFRQYEWTPPTRGVWQVRVQRITAKSGLQTTNTVVLATAAGIRERAPLDHAGPLALTEMRIKATSMANGTLDALNGVVQRHAPVWTGTDWVDALTRNPASSALAMLQSPAGAWPVEAGQIHWDEFVDLYEFAEAKGLKFDRVLSGDQSMGEALHSILAGGRATWRRDGLGWGVIIDRPQDGITDLISPLNASSIRWSRSYLRRPDAFRVTFRDETNGWEQAERIVPWPGFEGVPQTYEELQLEGKTDPDEIWIEARRRQHELDLRADTFTCYQTGAVRHATRGDAVALSCDILDEVQVAARVRRVDGRGVVLDTPVAMEDGLHYVLKWHLYDAEDTVGAAVQASVVTTAGEHTLVLLAPGSETPPPEAEVHFGLATRVDVLCRITSIEPAQDQSYRLTMQTDDPDVDVRTDAEVPPAWVSIAGEDVLTSGTPEVPVIDTITLEPAEYDYSGTALAAVAVPVSMPLDNFVSIARIDVSHRLSGAPGYTVTEVAGTSGRASLSYPLGSVIEVFATAVSVFGDVSAASTVATFEVTGTVSLPTGLDPDGMSGTGGPGYAQITLATAADTTQVQLFRVASGAVLDPDAHQVGARMAVPSGSTVALVDGDSSRSTLVDAGAWTATDVTITDGIADHPTGTMGLLAQSLTLTDAATHRGQIVVSGLTAGTITVRLAGGTAVEAAPITADGAHLFALVADAGNDRIEIEWSSDCDATIALSGVVLFRASATAAPQGDHDYYAAPISADNIANIPSGPVPVRII